MARTVPTASNGVPVYKNLHTADCWEGVVFGGESGPVVGVRVQSQPGADPGTPRRRKICIMHDLCFWGGGSGGLGGGGVLMPEQRDTVQSAQNRRRSASN